MLLAIVYERVDKRGRKRYVAKWRYIAEEKPFYIMGGGPRWTHGEIAVLVENRHNLDKAAKLLGRSRAACQKQLYRLGLSLGVTKEKKSEAVVVVFLQPQIDSRKAVIMQVLPRLKTLEKIDESKDLAREALRTSSPTRHMFVLRGLSFCFLFPPFLEYFEGYVCKDENYAGC